MIHIIRFQNGKKLQDIIYQISNKETRDDFRRVEDRFKYLIWVSMILYGAFYFFYFSYNIYPFIDKKWKNIIMMSKDIIGPLFLILMGIELLHLLYRKYNFEFH